MAEKTRTYEETKVIKNTYSITEYSKVILVTRNEHSFFASKKQYNNLKSMHPEWKEITIIKKIGDDGLVYLSKEEYEKLTTTVAKGTQKFFDIWGNAGKRDISMAVKESDFDPCKVVKVDWSTYMMYKPGEDLPISTPYMFNYINGITNEDFNMKKAMAILEKNKNVSLLEEEHIPYYNRTSKSNQGLKFIVRLPQRTHNDMWKHFGNHEFVSCRVNDNIIYKPYNSYPRDVLGLKPAYIERFDDD
jgi:hypothetical protein